MWNGRDRGGGRRGQKLAWSGRHVGEWIRWINVSLSLSFEGKEVIEIKDEDRLVLVKYVERLDGIAQHFLHMLRANL